MLTSHTITAALTITLARWNDSCGPSRQIRRHFDPDQGWTAKSGVVSVAPQALNVAAARSTAKHSPLFDHRQHRRLLHGGGRPRDHYAGLIHRGDNYVDGG
jgi:hypothetical protein